MSEKKRIYIKADDGEFIEVEGRNGHYNSVRKIMRGFGHRPRYGWIHGSRCISCGMKVEHFGKSKCPVRKQVTRSTKDLMALHLIPHRTMGGTLEGWS